MGSLEAEENELSDRFSCQHVEFHMNSEHNTCLIFRNVSLANMVNINILPLIDKGMLEV
jgi:hypothetical protein